MKEASFSLMSYSIVRTQLNFESTKEESSHQLKLSFAPSGTYYKDKGIYNLVLVFRALGDDGNDIVSIKIKAIYKFKDVLAFDDIPAYFYANSIAIIFPYLRAFVSTITLQANVLPIVLPTYNMSVLDNELRDNTTVK